MIDGDKKWAITLPDGSRTWVRGERYATTVKDGVVVSQFFVDSAERPRLVAEFFNPHAVVLDRSGS